MITSLITIYNHLKLVKGFNGRNGVVNGVLRAVVNVFNLQGVCFAKSKI